VRARIFLRVTCTLVIPPAAREQLYQRIEELAYRLGMVLECPAQRDHHINADGVLLGWDRSLRRLQLEVVACAPLQLPDARGVEPRQ